VQGENTTRIFMYHGEVNLSHFLAYNWLHISLPEKKQLCQGVWSLPVLFGIFKLFSSALCRKNHQRSARSQFGPKSGSKQPFTKYRKSRNSLGTLTFLTLPFFSSLFFPSSFTAHLLLIGAQEPSKAP